MGPLEGGVCKMGSRSGSGIPISLVIMTTKAMEKAKMKSQLIFFCVLALFLGGTIYPAQATIIEVDDFETMTIIDFEDASSGLINDFYQEILPEEDRPENPPMCSQLYGGFTYETGTGNGPSKTATNFFEPPFDGLPAGEITWRSPISRVGFYITTNSQDDQTTVAAYFGSGDNLVGFHTFSTFGGGTGGSFIGIEFLTGFDRIVIDPTNTSNGAFAMDDLMYDSMPVPEPTTMFLLGTGLVGLVCFKKKLKNS
jgi:hypothetical protein